jgi:hypothetical protein
VRYASGSHIVSAGRRNALPLTEGASLVVIYRVLSPNFPLKSVVIYDGSRYQPFLRTQNVQGFYDAVGGANGQAEYDPLRRRWKLEQQLQFRPRSDMRTSTVHR